MAASKPLPSGTSELDTVVLRLPDYGKEVRNWTRYTFNSQFCTPTAGWSFTLSDQDAALTADLCVPGAAAELVVNGRVQCTGFIDRQTIDADGAGGTVVTVQGRDILGPVVDATTDSAFKFPAGCTVPELVATVLRPFGITTIYNADLWNLKVITGYEVGSPGASTGVVKARVQKSTPNADGTVTLSYDTVDSSVVVSPTRPDLKTLTVQDAKPHAGEGVYAYLDRLLRRLGLTLWAMADGSGVVLDKADFTSAPQFRLTHKVADPSRNNILRGQVAKDLTSQPSVIVATGFGGGKDVEKSKLRVIMVNELTGLNKYGGPLTGVQDIIDRYPSALVLPLRSQLKPLSSPMGDRHIVKPYFLKDDESKNLAQLEAFVRREMANRQKQALTVSYDVLGHTQGGHPWSINTLVAVDDDKRRVHETLWTMEKSFTKSASGGTTTSLKLIRPFTFQIAQ